MRLFGNPPTQKYLRHSFSMAADKDAFQEQQEYRPRKSLENKKQLREFQKKHSPQVTGQISSFVSEYLLSGKGAQQGSFASVNFSSLPAAQKRVLQSQYASYNLTNYTNADFPPAIYITCAQVSGMLKDSNEVTHIIAVLLPLGCSVPVYNSGGIVGFNQTYGLKDTQMQYDITNVNQLTFDVSISQDGASLAYPLSQTLVYGIKVANATF